MKRAILVIGVMLTITSALPLRAQTGCDDSPENPTVALALLGAVGAVVTGLRARRNRGQ
jgi:XrtJ-associated TM-motif-TM protein